MADRRTCNKGKCKNPHHARGMCRKHYRQWYYLQHKTTEKAAMSRWQKENQEHKTEYTGRWKTAHKDRVPTYNRRGHLQHRYGITEEEYDRLLTEQGGVCAICGRPPKTRRLDTDHNHKTGVVRGLLCHLCNRALGLLRADSGPELCKAAASYLEKV